MDYVSAEMPQTPKNAVPSESLMPIPTEVPISHLFSDERIKDIEGYSKDRIQSLVRGLRGIREEKINKWRKVYNGTPREKTKSFPWQNASNVVIQLVGSYVDQLVAKIVMGSVAMEPLFTTELVGEFPQEDNAEKQRVAVEEWLAYRMLEPSQVNYLPKAVIWIRNMVRYGFGAIKVIPEKVVEQVVKEDGGFREYVRHNGPVAYPIMFEDFLMPSTTIELERSPFIAQRSRFERFEIESMLHDPSYDRARIREALKSPTRQGPDRNQQQIENETGAKIDTGNSVVDQWDVYECYFPYNVAGKKFQLISTCIADDNAENPRFIKSVFNWLPDNSLPYTGARLGSDGERAYGFGFCEMLKDYQEEVTAIHNRRGDASTLANTNLIRIDTGQQIDTQFSIFPNATVPAAKDAIEVIPLGRTANETIKDEGMSLQLAQDRAGVGPSSSGSGGGTVNKKGSYSAMGTFATMQEGNTRANLNLTEFRQSHYCFGRTSLMYDAHFGVAEKDIQAMGKMGQYLQKALENVKSGKIILPVRAATGSVNKEIEKQNLMLYLNNWRAHVQMVMQLMQGLSNPMAPPEYQHYVISTIIAGDTLMTKISRDFGIPDPSGVLPEPLGLQDKADDIQQQQRQQQLNKALQLSMPAIQQQQQSQQPPPNGAAPPTPEVTPVQ
jgi:hypothetical protein